LNSETGPEERAYKILQDSKFVRVEGFEESIDAFLKASDSCSWEYPKDKIQERQFETSLKNYFEQFWEELKELAQNNPPTFDGKPEPFMDDINLHTMDDQGFEGQVLSDGSYYRWINDSIDDEKMRPYKNKSDSELESMWQAQANMITQALSKAYDDNTDKEESDRCMQLAKKAQEIQSQVQDEITRRAK